VSEELQYILVVFGLFIVPRILQRFRLPSAFTCAARGLLGGAFGLDDGRRFWVTPGQSPPRCHAIDAQLCGALIVFALVNTLGPGFTSRAAPPEFDTPDVHADHVAVASAAE